MFRLDFDQRLNVKKGLKTTLFQNNMLECVVLLAVVVTLMVGGCASQPEATRIEVASNAYHAGDYSVAYRYASSIAKSSSDRDRYTAAYIAGNSAQKLGDLANAEKYLKQASFSSDRRLAGDAAASLGLVYAQLGDYDISAKTLLRAADLLDGEDKAKAYFYAGVSLQKLGRWAQARTTLVLARQTSDDPAFCRQVDDQLAVTGYTLQVGAFRNAANARQAAEAVMSKCRDLQLAMPRLVSDNDRFGRDLTLVQVGEFATYYSALRVRGRFADSSIIIVPLAK